MNVKIFANRFAVVCGAALVLLAGCQKKEEAPVAPPPPPAKPAKPALVSAVKNSFDEVTAKLDRGGNFYLYLSTEEVLTNLSTGLSTASNFISGLPSFPGTGRQTLDKVFSVAGAVIKQSGVSEISGLGMSSIAREPHLFYNKFVLHHYPGQNDGLIWTVFGKTSHPLAELDLLPENTALAISVDFDLPLFWTNLLQVIQTLDVSEVSVAMDQAPGKFKALTGLDLDAVMNSLSGEYGLILTLDTNKMISLPLGLKTLDIPTPGLCLVFKVNSNLIFDRVDEVLKGNPLLTKVDEPNLKMRTMTIPLPLPVALRPSLARVGDYMLLASSDTMVQDIVAVKSGKTKGYKATDDFKRLSQGVPSEGNNFTLATTVFGRTFVELQEKNMANSGMDPEAVKTLEELMKKNGNSGAYSIGANGPDGWVGTGNGASEGAAAVILPVAFTAGLLAAIAIPNFVKARTTSQENACINNLRLIDAAKQQWALEKGKKSTDTPTTEDLQVYLGRGQKGEMPTCPAGGVYTYGAVGEKPTCSHPGHVLP